MTAGAPRGTVGPPRLRPGEQVRSIEARAVVLVALLGTMVVVVCLAAGVVLAL